MKTKLLFKSFLAGALLLVSNLNFGQAPPLGTASDFVLFTSVGAMQNVGTYQYLTLLTGNVGTNSGSNTNFGNVNGVMHSGDGATAQADADLIIARNFLVAAIHDFTIINPVIGNNTTVIPGTYLFPASAVSLDQSLTLDAQGDPNAVFIFKMAAVAPVYAFSTSVNAKVKLINGAQASNVFWYISGAVDMAAGTSMKGTIIAGGAIAMGANDTLEGRALTINGSVTVSNGDLGFLAYLPVDVSSPLPTGPAAPVFVESKDYVIFSSIGNVTDDGTSHINGSVGGNSALPTGFNPLFVSGNIDGMNPATAGAAADLLLVYNSLNSLVFDIDLLAPAQFGHNLVLTPNIYNLFPAVTFTDTVFMDACGNPDAVFIIKTYGAFASGVNSRVVLLRGAQAKNVFWMVNGAVSIGDNSIFRGTIIANNGAIDMLTGASLIGRALTTNGAISVTAMSADLPNTSTIITQPVNQIICEGNSIAFTVAASGAGTFTYQWRKGTVNLVNSGNISGATSNTLTINPTSATDAALNYNVRVFSTVEPTYTSSNASLVVNTAPAITLAPANQQVCLGTNVSFSVVATGTALTYQWRKGLVNLTNTGNVSGVTNDTLTVNAITIADTASNFNVVISSTCGAAVTSANASLAVNAIPTITTQPISKVICDSSLTSFVVVAKGTGLTYQWRKGIVNLTNSGNISGATNDTLIFNTATAMDTAADYNVIVSGTCAPGVTSNNVSLLISSVININTQPANQSACAGNPVTFTIAATGAGLTYQWRKDLVNLTNTGNVTGATSNTLTIDSVTIADTAANYNVLISGTCAATVTSANASLKLNSAPAITTQPVDESVKTNEIARFTVVATGTALTYQWRIGTVNLVNAGFISGVDSTTLTIDPVAYADTATTYNVIVSGACTPSDTSANAALIITGIGSAIRVQPVEAVVCDNSAAIFTVNAVGADLSYQWRLNDVNLVDGGNISGATTATMIIDPVTTIDVVAGYNVVVSQLLVPIDTSDFVAIVIGEGPVITSVPVTQTSCAGILTTFEVTATGTNLTYQWRRGTENLVEGDNISGSTTNTLVIDPVSNADAATNYNVVVSGTCSPSITSPNVALEITPVGIDQFVGNNNDAIKMYPNPFKNSINIIINDDLQTQMNGSYELSIYDALGNLVIHTQLTDKVTTVETMSLKSGFYFFKVTDNGKFIQSGKLISK